jgi:hypothetical protein
MTFGSAITGTSLSTGKSVSTSTTTTTTSDSDTMTSLTLSDGTTTWVIEPGIVQLGTTDSTVNILEFKVYDTDAGGYVGAYAIQKP